VKIKKIMLATVAAGALLLTSCSGNATPGATDGGNGGGDGGLIGVAMPTKSSERWIQDGNAVKAELESQGFTVDLQYAEDDIPTQVSQIENMITKGAEALIVASIDGGSLSDQLDSAAKAGILGLTKAMANELAPANVQDNAVAPGYIATNNTAALQADEVRNRQIMERIPTGRWGKPEDIAGAAVFLASPASDYVTGHVLAVDGGWLAR
jgi:NAD(P)-dependent dehydrogenase (short-subunit alcohol dehydrogenase family)